MVTATVPPVDMAVELDCDDHAVVMKDGSFTALQHGDTVPQFPTAASAARLSGSWHSLQ